MEDFGYRNDIRDLNNVAPRVGFAWNVKGDNDFVIRGGTGIYFSSANSPTSRSTQALWNGQRVITNTFVNDGKPGWVLDPTRGVTADEVLSGRFRCSRRASRSSRTTSRCRYAWQAMIGFQKQLTELIGFDADLVQYKG